MPICLTYEPLAKLCHCPFCHSERSEKSLTINAQQTLHFVQGDKTGLLRASYYSFNEANFMPYFQLFNFIE